MAWILRAQQGNRVSLEYSDIIYKGTTVGQNGVEIKAKYTANVSEQLIADIGKIPQGVIIPVTVTWNIDGETEEREAYITLTGGYEEYTGQSYLDAVLEATYFLAPGTYQVKASIPQHVESDIVFCVYQYNPETDGYTDEVGCYSTYQEAQQAANQCDCIVSARTENVVTSGSVDIDLGTVTIAGKKTPTKPPKEPIWYPGKFLKKLIGG